jgi:hypothetical protein
MNDELERILKEVVMAEPKYYRSMSDRSEKNHEKQITIADVTAEI